MMTFANQFSIFLFNEFIKDYQAWVQLQCKKMTLYINLIQGVSLFYCAPIPLVRKKIIVESLLPLPLLADVIYVNGPLTDL